MNIKIRKATLNDLDVLLNFEQQLIDVERPMDPSLEQKKKINYFDIPEFITSDTAEMYVAIVDNKIVGCGYGLIKQNKSKFTQKKQGYIGFIFVKEEYRGKGVNKCIFEAIFNWFKTKGIIEIRLSVYEKNPRAIKAYEKIGFKKNLVEMLHYLT
ncbi:MAG: GNAT family N-acetyltransferase [Flavobacteriaceae bacterium]|nr:GNAT family N-acetyltransferase [Flavobacteriaceae bacterium]